MDSTNNETSQQQSGTQTRAINNLPFPPASDYTPYFGLEFDLAVQEYCRNRTNYQMHKSNDLAQKMVSRQKTQQAISTHKVVRSCKVVVSGDVAVGKTCLVNRFGHEIYSSNYQTTIGVDFDLQRFNILGQQYILQIWDTAGLERFRCITNSYYRGCQVALLIFDISNMSTLASVLKWKEEVLSSSQTYAQLSSEHDSDNRKQNDSPLLFLVGTKNDLPISESSRIFIREQANKVASILKAELWFVSAQTGENVVELFNRVAALSFNRTIQNEIQQIKFETSTLGAGLREKLMQQQKELWLQSCKLIKITKKKEGDNRRTRCVNVQCVIK